VRGKGVAVVPDGKPDLGYSYLLFFQTNFDIISNCYLCNTNLQDCGLASLYTNCRFSI